MFMKTLRNLNVTNKIMLHTFININNLQRFLKLLYGGLDTLGSYLDLCWGDPMMFRCGPAMFGSGPAKFRKGPAMFRGGSAMFRGGSAMFRGGPAIFRDGPAMFGGGSAMFMGAQPC